MSTHSYSRCWLHLTWETLRREPMLDERAASRASVNLVEYSCEKGIYMKINYFNADHPHALIDLPTNLTIERRVQLNITAREVLRRSMNSLSSGTDWNGAMRETVETVKGDREDCEATRLKPGENENSAKD